MIKTKKNQLAITYMILIYCTLKGRQEGRFFPSECILSSELHVTNLGHSLATVYPSFTVPRTLSGILTTALLEVKSLKAIIGEKTKIQKA